MENVLRYVKIIWNQLINCFVKLSWSSDTQVSNMYEISMILCSDIMKIKLVQRLDLSQNSNSACYNLSTEICFRNGLKTNISLSTGLVWELRRRKKRARPVGMGCIFKFHTLEVYSFLHHFSFKLKFWSWTMIHFRSNTYDGTEIWSN